MTRRFSMPCIFACFFIVVTTIFGLSERALAGCCPPGAEDVTFHHTTSRAVRTPQAESPQSTLSQQKQPLLGGQAVGRVLFPEAAAASVTEAQEAKPLVIAADTVVDAALIETFPARISTLTVGKISKQSFEHLMRAIQSYSGITDVSLDQVQFSQGGLLYMQVLFDTNKPSLQVLAMLNTPHPRVYLPIMKMVGTIITTLNLTGTNLSRLSRPSSRLEVVSRSVTPLQGSPASLSSVDSDVSFMSERADESSGSSRLQSLILDCCQLNGPIFELFMGVVFPKQTPALETVSLRSNSFKRPEDVRILTMQLRSAVHLDLSGNPLGVDGGCALLRVLEERKTHMKSLRLSQTSLGEGGGGKRFLAALAEVKELGSLEVLDLSGNAFTLFPHLPLVRDLGEFHFSDNLQCPGQSRQFVDRDIQRWPHLHVLTISRCNLAPGTDFSFIAGAVQHNVMREGAHLLIDITGNNMDDIKSGVAPFQRLQTLSKGRLTVKTDAQQAPRLEVLVKADSESDSEDE